MGTSFSWRRVGLALILGSSLLGLAAWVGSRTGSLGIGVFSVYAAITAWTLVVQVWIAARKPVSRKEWLAFFLFIGGFLGLGALHGWAAPHS